MSLHAYECKADNDQLDVHLNVLLSDRNVVGYKVIR